MFSPAFYSGWSRDELVMEAARLGVQNIERLNGPRLIDAVYNAELRRRQVELEVQHAYTAQPPQAAVPVEPDVMADNDYHSMSATELRQLADQRGLDHRGAMRKADLIDLLEGKG